VGCGRAKKEQWRVARHGGQARKRQEKINTEDTEEEAQRTQRRVEEFKVEELKWNQEAECGNEPTADSSQSTA